MPTLPGRYKARKPRPPRSSGGPCRLCGQPRDRDEAAASRAAGRSGLCRACLMATSVPLVME
jgi:hypothetical protein